MSGRVSVTGTTSEKKGFLLFIAYAQVIGIILVVAGHSLYEYPDGCHGSTCLLSRLIYSFHMPTFMFASGFLMIYTACSDCGVKFGLGKFLKKKAKRLLVPFVVLTSLTFVPRVAMSSMADDSLEFSWAMFSKALFYGEIMPIPYFWFLQASFLLLMTSYFLLYAGCKVGIGKNLSCWIIGIIYMSLLLWGGCGNIDFFSIGKAVRLGVSFAMGMIYACYFKRVNNLCRLQSWKTFMCIVSVWVILFCLTEYSGYFMLCQLAGVWMVISLSHIMVEKGIRILDNLVGATYMIFLLSWYLNMLTQPVLAHYVCLPWWCYTILSCIFGVYVPFFVYLWLSKCKDRSYGRGIMFCLGHS